MPLFTRRKRQHLSELIRPEKYPPVAFPYVDGMMSNASGLRQSKLPEKERRGRIWCYDLFRTTPIMSTHYLKDSGLKPGDSFQPIFEKNVSAYADYITLHPGDIPTGAGATFTDRDSVSWMCCGLGALLSLWDLIYIRAWNRAVRC